MDKFVIRTPRQKSNPNAAQSVPAVLPQMPLPQKGASNPQEAQKKAVHLTSLSKSQGQFYEDIQAEMVQKGKLLSDSKKVQQQSSKQDSSRKEEKHQQSDSKDNKKKNPKEKVEDLQIEIEVVSDTQSLTEELAESNHENDSEDEKSFEFISKSKGSNLKKHNKVVIQSSDEDVQLISKNGHKSSYNKNNEFVRNGKEQNQSASKSDEKQGQGRKLEAQQKKITKEEDSDVEKVIKKQNNTRTLKKAKTFHSSDDDFDYEQFIEKEEKEQIDWDALKFQANQGQRSKRNAPSNNPKIDSEKPQKPKAQSARKPKESAQKPEEKSDQEAISQFLAGMTIVFTGEFSLSRDKLSSIVIENGGRNTKSVSKKTSIVVYGSVLEDGRPPEQGKKYQEAVKNNTLLMNQTQFSEFLKEKTGKSLEEHAGSAQGDRFSKFSALNQPIVEQVPPSSGQKNKKVLVPVNIPKEQRKSDPKPIQPIRQAQKNQPPQQTELWTQKYAPKLPSDIVGNEHNFEKMMEWLHDWHDVVIKGNKKQVKNTFYKQNMSVPGDNSSNVNAKACLLSGPPGVGKTTSVRLIAKYMGYDVREWNASDERNKKSVNFILGDLKTNSILHLIRKKEQTYDQDSSAVAAVKNKFIILMDEIDGMSSGDRGGNAALIDAIKSTNVPIFCICNDRMNPKVRSLANYCYDIKFAKPAKQDIATRMVKICQSEGFQKVESLAIEEITSRLGCDLRQTLNYLEMHFKTSNTLLRSSLITLNSNQKDVTVMMQGFEASLELMHSFKFQKLSLRERVELFFIDYDLIPLLVQQNYLDTIEKNNTPSIKELEDIAQATAAIAEGDIISSQIRAKNNWSLLPNFAFLSSIYPCDKACGNKPVYPRFPDWLGKYSSQKKTTRELRELRISLAKAISGSRFAVKFDYLPTILKILIRLLKNPSDQTFEQILSFMEYYGLKPDHLKEHLSDLQYPKMDYYAEVPSNIKSKLTRLYNQRFTDDSKKVKQDKKSKVQHENQPKYDKNLDDVVYSDEEAQDQDELEADSQKQTDENEDVSSQTIGKTQKSVSLMKNFKMAAQRKETPMQRNKQNQKGNYEDSMNDKSQSSNEDYL